jgi:uncharacterized membrane protein
MKNKIKENKGTIVRLSEYLTEWIGSPQSLITHTVLFTVFFLWAVFWHAWDRVLLILTTVVSLEAIYLAIFIQMTVNRNTISLAEVEEDIDEIQEDIDEIQEDVGEIQEDVGEIQEDVDVIHDEVDELGEVDKKKGNLDSTETLRKIYDTVERLSADLDTLKKEIERS